MPRSLLVRPFAALALPGIHLVDKITEFKRHQQEQNRRKITERELAHLNHKIDKLLCRLEEHEPELASSQEEECAICISAKATMQTFPCGHKVVCRKCFVKTIQMAVSQRMLPLRCVICRAKILRLKQTSQAGTDPLGISPLPSIAAYRNSFSAHVADQLVFAPFDQGALPSQFRNHESLRADCKLDDPKKHNQQFPLPSAKMLKSNRWRHYSSRNHSSKLLPIPESEELELVQSVRSVSPRLYAENDAQDKFKADIIQEIPDDIQPPLKDPIKTKKGTWHVLTRFYTFRTPSLLKKFRRK